MVLRPTADPVEAAVALGPLIRAHAAETEAGRQLARPVVDALLDAGIFALNRPVALGGAETDPITMFRVVEELARHDSAAAWIVAVSLMGNVFLSFYPDEGAEEIAGSPGLVMSGAAHPVGRAERVDGGYLVTGRWQFFSGCQCSTWWHAKAALDDGTGEPTQLYLCVPADPAAIDELVDLATTKTANFGGALARRASAQHQVAEAEARLGAARAFLFQVYADAWDAALAGQAIELSLKLRMQLAGTHAANEAAAAVDLVCAAAGSSAARMEYRFERLWRDARTITTQAFCSPGRYQSVGQLMFGGPSDWPFFSL